MCRWSLKTTTALLAGLVAFIPRGGALYSHLNIAAVTLVSYAIKVDVFYVVAIHLKSCRREILGFPAYDRAQVLLGFYKETQLVSGESQVLLRCSDLPLAITQAMPLHHDPHFPAVILGRR